MNQQLRLAARLPQSTLGLVEDNDRLLHGIRLRWSALSQSERLVCLGIVLLPLWWLLGWAYMMLMLTIGIVVYEHLHNGGLRLQRPSLIACSALTYGLFRLVSIGLHLGELTPHLVLGQLNDWICCGLLIWYIQSKDIRVRPLVVAWACSIAVLEMLVFWLIVHFIFKEPSFTPSLSIFGLLTNKSERYVPGSGSGNYLIPYLPGDKALAGLSRFCFFFVGPESFAMLASYIGLLAFDIKNRWWSLLMVPACIFLLLLSGTRSAWIIFPLLVTLRYLWMIGKVWGPALLYFIIAVASFITFSLPPTTDLLSDSLTHTAKATSKYRADSTETRHKIYARTLDAVWNEPDQLLFGHAVSGSSVLPGYAPARIGSHSFILGTLLYQSGLVGSGVFLTFWASFILWVYNTRTQRPLSSLLMLLYFSLTFLVMEIEMTIVVLIFLSTVRDKSVTKLNNRRIRMNSMSGCNLV